MLPSSQVREVTIRDYLVIVQRRIWIIAMVFFAITAFAAWRSFRQTPVFQTSAKVVIETTSPQISPLPEMYPTKITDKQYIRTQQNIIKSRALAEKTMNYLVSIGDNTFVDSADPAGAFMAGIAVGAVEGTQIIEISYRDIDPLKATKYANALAQNFIEQDIERKLSGVISAENWLESGIRELQEKLKQSEERLIDYIRVNEIVSVPDIERERQSVLEGLRQQKVDLENNIAEASKRYKEKHPKMISLRTRLQAVEQSVKQETKNLFSLNEKLVEYKNLKRDVESNRALYESLLRKAKETEVSKELLTTDLRILDLAQVPSSPVSPNRQRDVTTGAMWGLVLGMGVAFFIEFLDSTLKNAEDVETYLRLPFLGYVASLRSEKDEVKGLKDFDLISQKIPHSRIAESYRSIRTSIIFSAPEDRPLKTILITSSLPREGKTFISTNLGIVFAHTNEPIIVIESDMRKPRISNIFGMKNDIGLSSFLTGKASLEEVIKPTSVPSLSVIVSGPIPPNPTELLTSAKIQQFFDELKSRFSRIIIDSPPVLYVADTALLANIVDGVIHVVRAGKTNINHIIRARQKLTEAKAKVVGIILNDLDVKREDSYYYYHYYYYSRDKDKRRVSSSHTKHA